MPRRSKTACADCGKETVGGGSIDYYSVHDELWAQHGVGRGFLCFACLERRVGRPLVVADFVQRPASLAAIAWCSAREGESESVRSLRAREIVEEFHRGERKISVALDNGLFREGADPRQLELPIQAANEFVK